MLKWRRRYGRLPTSYDWSRTHARRRGGEAPERLARGEWPAASVISNLFGTWAAARVAVSGEDMGAPQTGGPEPVELIGHTGDLCAQSPQIARKIRQPEDVPRLAEVARFAGSSCIAAVGPRVIRVGEVPGSNPGAPI
jgi:hypothetical protein